MQKNYKYHAWEQQQRSALSAEDTALLENYLKESPLNPGIIVRQGDLFMDFGSAKSLIGKRWVDNFVINLFCTKSLKLIVSSKK